MTRILVLGGGISGLLAAWHLQGREQAKGKGEMEMYFVSRSLDKG